MPDWLIILLLTVGIAGPFALHYSERWFIPRSDDGHLPS